jgi:N-acyl-D-amino-acid deacylase
MFDVLIAGGDVYDGTGSEPLRADVGVLGDRVAAVGPNPAPEAAAVIDATGKAVCPGFINVLSHSYFSILHDPRSLGELTQGVTTEVFGEGTSMGPLTPQMQAELRGRAGQDHEVTWTRLSEYLRHVEQRGASQNVASFIGSGTLRVNAVGYSDRPATHAELDRMRALAAEEMADGALGIASALIYPPGSYAGTAELTALCKVAAGHDGCYASHVRGEGENLHEAIAEFLAIVRDAGLRGEVFHLKASGRPNWHRMDGAIERSRATGMPVTADVYPYTASSTGLTSIIPDRYHEGGPEALYDRLGDPRVGDGHRPTRGGDGPHRLRPNPDTGRVLLHVRAEPPRGARSPARPPARPWVAISSDGMSMAPEGAFLRAPTHPRAYGSFARVLGRYARDEKVLPLAEAIRRMSALPAATLGLRDRGVLRPGLFADIVVFDPATVQDRATFSDPHQLSAGVSEVLVNGRVTISNGTLTGELAGRALAGPGARR